MCRVIFNFLRIYFGEMRRKLWLKAPAKEGALGQMSKNFQFYFIHIFLRNQIKKIGWVSTFGTTKCRTADISEFRNFKYKNNESRVI